MFLNSDFYIFVPGYLEIAIFTLFPDRGCVQTRKTANMSDHKTALLSESDDAILPASTMSNEDLVKHAANMKVLKPINPGLAEPILQFFFAVRDNAHVRTKFDDLCCAGRFRWNLLFLALTLLFISLPIIMPLLSSCNFQFFLFSMFCSRGHPRRRH